MMQHFTSQIGYWNSVATEKRFSHPLRLHWLARYASQQARILDYGCGYGRTLAELSETGYKHVFGVDFSERMLERSRFQVPFSKVVRNDGQHLSFKDDCFDVVLLFAVLTCIPDSNAQRRLLAETERALRPGGLIYVSDLLVNSDLRNRKRYQQFAETYGCYGVFELAEGIVVRHHEREWMEKITSSFEQLEFEPFMVTTMNGNLSSAFQYLGRKQRR